MVTKTLTITEDAYNILAASKFEGESFSEEVRRLFSQKKKKRLIDFFGILADDGEGMQKDLEKIRKMNVELLKERLKMHESA
ncbi:antitoxin VapB family protein [Candidatus Woesearchaeota archaeon]|nr:antitoxin VapB family protein [Candidatus Woesearchaeota archaeon]